MKVTIETKARPCPGVERAIVLAEEVLRRGDVLYAAGELIHNKREIQRLMEMGLRHITIDAFNDSSMQQDFIDAYFLMRTHGEPDDLIDVVRNSQMRIVDATCSIVRHSQDLVDQHVREGFGIVIAGSKTHPEVRGLLTRAKGCGVIVSSKAEAEQQELDSRTLLLAQTTIDPELFTEIRRILKLKQPELKIVDTTCRFLQKRQRDLAALGSGYDVVIIVGGQNSSNCRLLHNTALDVNARSYHIEHPDEVDLKWFTNNEKVAISGGASTPRWQLEEMKSFLNTHQNEENPKGLKNRKGGTFLWWKRKNHKTT